MKRKLRTTQVRFERLTDAQLADLDSPWHEATLSRWAETVLEIDKRRREAYRYLPKLNLDQYDGEQDG